MATSESWVQDVITCDLCDKPTQQFCNSCQVSLCDGCVRKHRDQFKSLSHEIVPFLDRKIELVFFECQDHSGRRCEINCKDCNIPVCVKCILSGPHKGHDVELTETYESKRQKIKTDTQKIKAQIKKYQKKEADLGIQISETKAKFEDLGKKYKKVRQLWHKEVDSIFDKIDSLSHARKDENLDALTTYQNKIKSFISDLNETVEKNKKIIKSNKLSDINNYQSKLKDFPKNALNMKMPSFKTKIDHGRQLILELGDYRATLTQRSQPSLSADISRMTTKTRELMAEVRAIATISTNYRPLHDITCVGETEAWICGDHKTIARIDIHGSVKDTVNTTCQYGIEGISLTREREVVYSYNTFPAGSVNIVRQGKSETLITTPWGWRPSGLCCTRSGDILVNMLYSPSVYVFSFPKENKIVRYQGKRIMQEIYKDEHGKFIFEVGSDILYMSENSNGDICVSDANANTVVVVDRKGRVRFRYDGTAAKRKEKFAPKSIVTDALSQIIVADSENNCLHILDENGQFMRCLDDIGAGILGLSVDSKGRLWVGLSESGTIKVIENWK